VSNYYEAMSRPLEAEEQRRADASMFHARVAGTNPLVPLPVLDQVPAAVARAGAIRDLSERLAPLAVVENSVRLGVTACRPGDGASTVAAALAIDLSQRLGLRTILVDAHLRHPSLHRLFLRNNRRAPELVLDGALQVRATDWPRLELVSCCLAEADSQQGLFDQFDALLGAYPAVVIDLGVTRLDARMLPLARPNDPMLAVARHGQTERRELATTTAALRAAGRTVAGIILNGATDPVAKPLRRILRKWANL
jgi:Mrp family chromosome partitioning ATPase